MKQFVFLSGLPRTGSTLLGTLLSQHPDLHTTSTSVVRNLMEVVLSYQMGQSLYYDRHDPNSPLWGILRGILSGAYDHVTEKVIVEKDRGWAKDIPVTEKVLGHCPRIIAPVRPLPEVIASFVLIAQKVGPTAKIYDELRIANRETNPWTLSRIIWEKYVYANWRTFKAGYENHPECFHLLEYEDLVEDPQTTMKKVYEFVGVAPIETKDRELVNPHPENDSIYGLPGLHDIRPKLERVSPPAEEVLGTECYRFWERQGLEFWKG